MKVFIIIPFLFIANLAVAEDSATFLFWTKTASCPLVGGCGLGFPGSSAMRKLTVKLAPDGYDNLKGEMLIKVAPFTLKIDVEKYAISKPWGYWTILLWATDPETQKRNPQHPWDFIGDAETLNFDLNHLGCSDFSGRRLVQDNDEYFPIMQICGLASFMNETSNRMRRISF